MGQKGSGQKARERIEAGRKGGEQNGNPYDSRLHSDGAEVCGYPGSARNRVASI